MAAIKSFCAWCVRTHRLPDNLLAHFSKLNEEVDIRRERRTLNAAEIAHLIDTTEKCHAEIRGLSSVDRAMLYLFAVGTGLRASELGSLTTASLCMEDDPPTVVAEAAFSKRRRRDVQPMPTWLVDRMREWLIRVDRNRLADTLRTWRTARPIELGEQLGWRAARPSPTTLPTEP